MKSTDIKHIMNRVRVLYPEDEDRLDKLRALLGTIEEKEEFTQSERDLLKTFLSNGSTVAHELVFLGLRFTDPEILRITDIHGRTVAHEMATMGHVFEDRETQLIGSDTSHSVAEEMATRGYQFTEEAILSFPKPIGIRIAFTMLENHKDLSFKNKDILKFASETGWTIAHELASRGHVFTDMEILQLATDHRWTVAHEMAHHGHVFMDEALQRWANASGWTIAHEMVSKGHGRYIENPEIFTLTDTYGWTVKMEHLKYRNEENSDDTSVIISTF
jgi:hypothetical protein